MTAKTKSTFIKLRCEECNNEQKIFDKPNRDIHCLICDNILAKSTGGKAKIEAEIIEEL